MSTRPISSRASYWQRLLEAHSRSGLSLRAFAAQANVSVNTLAYWKYKRPHTPPSSAIVPVTVIDDLPRAHGEFVIEFGAARLRIPSSIDPDQLVRALGGGC